MFSTFKQILSENWTWRHQTWNLAKFDLVRTYRGAALGKLWLFAKPAVYIIVFWVTLKFGFRSSSSVHGMPFILWLSCGVFPWFYISDIINNGSDVYHRYSYLVNRIKFPISLISTFYSLSLMMIMTAMMGFMIVACLIFRVPLTWYLIQLPLVMILMFVYWTFFSLLLSPLSAISRDFANLVKTIATPLFWLSGILFDVNSLHPIARRVMYFNPVSWSVEAVRDCFIYHKWFFLQRGPILAFLIVGIITVLLAVFTHSRLYKEIPDVL